MKEVCHQFNMIISDRVLDDLMDYCDVDNNGLIDFMEFSNFLNWKGKMPINKVEQKILTKGEFKCTCSQSLCQRSVKVMTDLLKPHQNSSTKSFGILCFFQILF